MSRIIPKLFIDPKSIFHTLATFILTLSDDAPIDPSLFIKSAPKVYKLGSDSTSLSKVNLPTPSETTLNVFKVLSLDKTIFTSEFGFVATPSATIFLLNKPKS